MKTMKKATDDDSCGAHKNEGADDEKMFVKG